MKFLLLLMLLPSVIFSQTVPITDGRAIFELADSSVKGTKDQLYDKAIAWIIHSFKNSSYKTEMDDRGAGEIIVIGTVPLASELLSSPMEKMEFSLYISVGEGAYKARIMDVVGWTFADETARTSLEQINYRYTKNGTGKGKEKYSADNKQTDKATLQNVLTFMENIQESFKYAMRK